MNTDNPFESTAAALAEFYASLLVAAKPLAQRENIPSLLELLTICRETGSRLLELESFAGSRDRDPAFLLCGSNAEFANEVAAKLELPAQFIDRDDRPLIWWLSGGSKSEATIRIGLHERTLSSKALHALLKGELPEDQSIIVHENVPKHHGWSMIWIPRPDLIEELLFDIAGLDVLFTQQAAICVGVHGESELASSLRGMKQKLWEVSPATIENAEARARILDESENVLIEDNEERNARLTSLWEWLVPRLLESIERHQTRYQLEIDRQAHKLQTSRLVLTEYRRNWTSNVQNAVDGYVQKKISGKSFESFYDAKKPGPTAETYLAALAPAGLWHKLKDVMTDRMAEFVAGLSALATKIEMRSISLQDVDTRWNPSRKSSDLEKLLKANKVFSEKGGAKLGLVGSLTGKSEEVVQARKSEIARATRVLIQAVNTDFAEWCENFFIGVEGQVKLQMTARLVNEGLPDSNALRGAIEGLDRLAAILRGQSESAAATPEALASDWLSSINRRHMIPRYERAQSAS